MVQPGDSAIIALLWTHDPALLVKQCCGYGGEVIQTTIAKDQAINGAGHFGRHRSSTEEGGVA